nr:FtsX-like permease family protein [uncultured Cetobacterium sp.]
MRFEIKTAIRFLTFNKRQTSFLVGAIALGVAVQVFITSLIVSLQGNIIDSMLGDAPHIVVEEGDNRKQIVDIGLEVYNFGNFQLTRDRIPSYKNLEQKFESDYNFKNIVPIINSNAIYQRQGKTIGLAILGINLKNADKLYKISNKLINGNTYLYSNNAIIGIGIQKEFQLKIGDNFDITLPTGKIEKMKITGIVDLENQQLNNSFVFIDINKAQKIFDLKGYVTKINIQLYDVFQAEEISKELENRFKDLKITPWTKDGQSLLDALKAQTSSTMVIQIIVMVATSLSIASVLFIKVVQKSKDVGILKAMGLNNKSSGIIFIIQGGFMGFFGSILGTFLGIGLIKLYMIGVNPPFVINIEWLKIFIIICISTTSGLIAAYFPAKKCMELNPIEVIRGG